MSLDNYFNTIKSKFIVEKNNRLKEVCNYISNELITNYDLGTILYNVMNYLRKKTNKLTETKYNLYLLELCFIFNYLYLLIDIIFSHRCFLNLDKIYNKPNIHVVYGDSLYELSLMYLSNFLGKKLFDLIELIDKKEDYMTIFDMIQDDINILKSDKNEILDRIDDDEFLLKQIKDKKDKIINNMLNYIYYLFDLKNQEMEINKFKIKILEKLNIDNNNIYNNIDNNNY